MKGIVGADHARLIPVREQSLRCRRLGLGQNAVRADDAHGRLAWTVGGAGAGRVEYGSWVNIFS